MKKVLILSGSPRKGGNSDILCDEFAKGAVAEMVELRLIRNEHDVLDFHVERVKKAYPAYFDTYEEINVLRTWLNTIPNLYCIGRNGQHRYNNIDHSMCTAFKAVETLLDGSSDKSGLWNVNTEREYHEAR
jgi:protoporphyrinogen oxidase